MMLKNGTLILKNREIAMKPQNSTASWANTIAVEKEKEYFLDILAHVNQVRREGKTVYPPQSDTFNALKMTPLAQVSVVIIGQDPYHGPNQAHGLCFSVARGITPPPSLKNIFKELQRDCDIPYPNHGCLTSWAKQGVLLLNTILTVEKGQAHSHANIGWETFTDALIKIVNDHCHDIVFLLWGSHAQKKSALIDANKHHILRSTHPSPLSAHRGFLGCGHFSKTNHILTQHDKTPIDWTLP